VSEPDVPTDASMRADEICVRNGTEDLNRDLVHTFLSTDAYWSRGIDRKRVDDAMDNSECFGAYMGDQQVGFLRLVTDYATFAYVCDVFVVPEYRRRGVGRMLLSRVVAFTDNLRLRRVVLVTRDAQRFYAQFGFQPLSTPSGWMELEAPRELAAGRTSKA
jgi:GNAT superfamily N-acetyltransferase